MRTTDNGIVIIEDFIPKGRRNRPGRMNPDEYITIHETSNPDKGAGAKAHANYLKGDTAARTPVSWHYTVDDTAIYQHLPDAEDAYHAGDGDGDGNRKSISIEICVNADSDYEQAKVNAAALVRLLLREHNLTVDKVAQHNHWSEKDCPKIMRASNKWDEFLAMCAEGSAAPVLRFNTIAEIEAAAPWAAATVRKLCENNFLRGGDSGLDLSMDMLRIFVVNDRAGIYDI